MSNQTEASYNELQTVFSLCTISNVGSLFNKMGVTTIKEEMTKAITNILGDANIQSYIGNWELAWGPYVEASFISGVAGNAMYIACNSSTEMYVVAIAGTDPSSVYEWAFEDFHIDEVKEWPYATTNPTAYISAGAYDGLDRLRKMGDIPVLEKTALEYLKDKNAKNIYVTGHSLGGTLAPLYALYAYNVLVGQYHLEGINISCIRFAGLTPGDDNLVNYYNSIPGISTQNVWNTNDVAPHLYQLNMVEEIQNLYPTAPWDSKYDDAYNDFVKYAAEYNYTQFPSSGADNYSPFTCPLYPANTLITLPASGSAPDPSEYAGQASCQHVPAYSYTLDVVDGFLTRVTELVNDMGYGTLVNGPYFTEGCPPPPASA